MAKKTKVLPMGLEEMKRPNRMRMSGRMARNLMGNARVGKDATYKVRGKVTGVSSNEYDDNIEMEMDHCEYCDEPHSLTEAMKARKRGRDGRYAS